MRFFYVLYLAIFLDEKIEQLINEIAISVSFSQNLNIFNLLTILN